MGPFGYVCAVTDTDNHGVFTKRNGQFYGVADTGVFKKATGTWSSLTHNKLTDFNVCPGKIAGMPAQPTLRSYSGGGPLCGCSPTDNPDIPNSADGSIPNSQTGYNFDGAAAHCESKGMRLCTVDELNADITLATGCFYTFQRVWTKSFCGYEGDGVTKKYFTTSGRSYCSFNPFKGETNTADTPGCEGIWTNGKCGMEIGMDPTDPTHLEKMCVRLECSSQPAFAVARCCGDAGGAHCQNCPRHANTFQGADAVDSGDCKCNDGYAAANLPGGMICYPAPVPWASDGKKTGSNAWQRCGAQEYEVFSHKKCSQISGTKSTASLGVCAKTPADACAGPITDTSSDGTLSRTDFFAAENFCEDQGMRLCTVDELENDAAQGTGCNYDDKLVWTRETCGLTKQDLYDDTGAKLKDMAGNTITKDVRMFWAVGGSSSGPAEKCVPSTAKEKVSGSLNTVNVYTRCCADIGNRPHCKTKKLGTTCNSWGLRDSSGAQVPGANNLPSFDDIAAQALAGRQAMNGLKEYTSCTCDNGWNTKVEKKSSCRSPACTNKSPGNYGYGGCSFTLAPTKKPTKNPTSSPTRPDATARPTRKPTNTPTKKPSRPKTLPPTTVARVINCPPDTYFYRSAKNCKELIRRKRYVNWIKNTTFDDKMADYDGDGDFEGNWAHGVCSSSKATRLDNKSFKSKCPSKMTFRAADAYCRASGGRLCTLGELQKDYAAGSGCNLDWKRVWSATSCGNGKYWATTGSSKFRNKTPNRCLGASNSKNFMRCCADGSKNACKPAEPWQTCPKNSASSKACTCTNGWDPKGGCKPPAATTLTCPKNQYLHGSPASCMKLEEFCLGGQAKCWRFGTWKDPNFKGVYPWSEGICANSIVGGDGRKHFARYSAAGCAHSNSKNGYVRYSTAKAFCGDAGARLPTREEVKKLVVRGTGCKNDRELIWTSSKCGEKKMWVVSGKGANKKQDPIWGNNDKCVPVHQKFGRVRCIGDVKGTNESGQRCVNCPAGSSKPAGAGNLYDCRPNAGKKWDYKKGTIVNA